MKRIWIALALLALARASIGAQDAGHEAQSLEDVHARMKELMVGVESRLKAIDELLTDAAACEKTASAASEVAKCMTTTRARAQQNLDDIDEILRLSLHPHPAGTGKGGGA